MPGEGLRFDAAERAPRTRVERLSDSLRIIQGLILILLGGVIVSSAATGSRWAHTAHGALALGEALVGLHVLLRGPRASQVVAGGALLALAANPVFAGRGDGSDGVAAACVTLCAVRALSGRRCAVTLIGLAGLYVVVRAGFGHPNVLESLQRTVPGSIDSWAGGALARFIERGAQQADAAGLAAERDELAVARHDAGVEAVRRAKRVLHDEVLVALSATATDADPARAAHRAELGARTLSRAAVQSVDALGNGSPSPDPLTRGPRPPGTEHTDRESVEAIVASVLRSAPVEVVVSMEVDGATPVLAPAAAAAVERALREGLRNVSLHSRSDAALLRVRARAGHVEITLLDDGPRGCVSRDPGFGIEGSILDPVRAVGGKAAVEVTDHGTEVRLRLPTQSRRPRLDVIGRARAEAEAAGGPIGGLIVPITIPLLTAQGVLNVNNTFDLPHRNWWLLLTVTLLVTGTVHSWIIARRSLSARAEFLFLSWLLGVVALVVAVTPTSFTESSIIWGSAGIYLFLWLFFMPLSWAATSLGCATVILGIAWVMAPPTDPAYLVTSANGFVLIPLFSAILGALVRRDGRAVIADRARRLDSLAELELRQQLSRAVSLHLDHTRRVIVPWLAKVADGVLDPTDPEVRARARVFEREARDDLHAAGFFDDRLREEVSRYRAHGGTVEIRPGLRPGSHARSTGRLLDSLVRSLPPEHRITVSPTPQDPERARVAVVPPPPAPLGAVIPPGARLVEHDQDRLVLTVREADG